MVMLGEAQPPVVREGLTFRRKPCFSQLAQNYHLIGILVNRREGKGDGDEIPNLDHKHKTVEQGA